MAQDLFLTIEWQGIPWRIPVGSVKEVSASTGVTRVPRAPLGIAGVMQWRGEIIPVADLDASRRPAGTPDPPPGAQVVVLEGAVHGGRRRIALLTDRVGGMAPRAEGDRASIVDVAPLLLSPEGMKDADGLRRS